MRCSLAGPQLTARVAGSGGHFGKTVHGLGLLRQSFLDSRGAVSNTPAESLKPGTAGPAKG
jgi:hypothetical protein